MSCWSDSGPSCRASRCVYNLKPITEATLGLVSTWMGDPLKHKWILTHLESKNSEKFFSEIVLGVPKYWEKAKKKFGKKFFGPCSLPPIFVNCGRTVGRIKNLRPLCGKEIFCRIFGFLWLFVVRHTVWPPCSLMCVLGLFSIFRVPILGCSVHFDERCLSVCMIIFSIHTRN